MLRKYIIFFFALIILSPIKVSALSLNELKQQIDQKQQEMKQMEDKVNIYKKDIEAKQNEAVTLSNQLAIIKSRSIKIELDTRVTESQMEILDLEITSLKTEIKEKEITMEKEKMYISSLLRSIHLEDQQDYLSIILQNPSFSEYFNHIKNLEDVNGQVDKALKQVKVEKNDLEAKQKIAETKNNKLAELRQILVDQKASLNEQKETKNYLLTQTKMSEAKFNLLLSQVRQDYAAVDSEIAALQQKIDKELAKDNKLDNQPAALSWPINPTKGISVYFHDPTYPFRYLFEHTGIDLPTSPGTPIGAAAAGYVAWVRTSRSYGNNIMIIHNDGIATLYAHLTRFNTSEGSFVKRGDIIGFSGGMPGTPGAGFSTGPHLHFEVRLNGLPTDPMSYFK